MKKIKNIILHDTRALSNMEMSHIIGAQIMDTPSRDACKGKADGTECSYKKIDYLSYDGTLKQHTITVNGKCTNGDCVMSLPPRKPR